MKKFLMIVSIIVGLYVSAKAEIMTQDSGLFYTAGVTVSTSTDYTTVSNEIDVQAVRKIAIQVYGVASSTSDTAAFDFHFATSLDGSIWDTQSFTYASMVMTSSTTANYQSFLIDVDGINEIKVLKIVNNNTSPSGDATGVNVMWGLKEDYR
jgi:hypothetical protein